MVKYNSARQLSFSEFRTPFEKGIDGSNRWVRLADQIPWDELSRIYVKSLRCDFGRPSVDARIVIGAMIIKYKKSLTDEETIDEIQENPYLQFFLGFKEFSHQRVFDPSLFVALRKRMGTEAFEQMNQAFITAVEPSTKCKVEQTTPQEKKTSSDCQKNSPAPIQSDNDESTDKNNQGQLIVDATVAPQDIKYPTDLDLLNASREKTERIIDELYIPEPNKRKPRTYRKIARQDYLDTARKKKKSKKALRKSIRKQLNYVKRNIKTINSLLDSSPKTLCFRSMRSFWIVQEVYRQQQEMYDNRSNKIPDRIISLSQPHVRPIVRGKAGKDVEFGAKISVSLVNGFADLHRLSWDAFNESGDLIDQVEKYRDRFGFYPEVVIADKIYGNRENRKYLESKGIRYSGKSLGRPPQLSAKEKRLLRSEARLRNSIEGKFGEGKRKYDLGLVKAKTMDTSESWIAAIFFVMNIAHWWRLYFFVFFFKRASDSISNIFKEHLQSQILWGPNRFFPSLTFSGSPNYTFFLTG